MATNPSKYQCKYCKKEFTKESTLAVHVCEQKRRHQEQDDRGVQLGLQAYLKFYASTQSKGRVRSWEDFATSPYYKAFVKFGRYCVNTRVINPPRFLDWLLKQNKKIDNWGQDRVYTDYLLDHLTVEAVDDALARAVEYSMDWSDRTGNPARDCLRYGNPNATCHAVTTGRISPWAIYNSESGQQFLSELNSQQVAMIWSYIDSDVWQKRFKDRPEDQAYAQEILTKAGW